ncbi:MAG: hypothetical protein M3R59_09270 [Verrucomicrobiota bacterium]|nr:hypothetical protein [Verrucomicrobiota bacterium]
MNMPTNPGVLLLGLCLLGGSGCRTAKTVAVTSFRVVDAPAHFVRRKIDATDQPQVTTTVVENQPATANQPPPPRPRVTPTPARREVVATSKPKRPTSSATPRPSAPATQYPVAKSVPGKPGYVFSPFDPNGGYVDVTGYASGSKVKDPYSQKIFLVP